MPIVIALVTLISRKWGNVIGGVIAGLPWVGGAILLFIALEQGKEFVLESLPAVYMGLICWIVYCVVYMLAGQKFSPFVSLLIGLASYILFGFLFQSLPFQFSSIGWLLTLYFCIFLSLRFFPKVKNSSKENLAKRIPFDIPLRMLMITAFVVGLTYFAKPLGPSWSGILTPFPVITAVLTVFTHISQGMQQVRNILIGMFAGVVGFSTFLLTLIVLFPNKTISFSFIAAFLINLTAAFGAKFLFSKVKIY